MRVPRRLCATSRHRPDRTASGSSGKPCRLRTWPGTAWSAPRRPPEPTSPRTMACSPNRPGPIREGTPAGGTGSEPWTRLATRAVPAPARRPGCRAVAVPDTSSRCFVASWGWFRMNVLSMVLRTLLTAWVLALLLPGASPLRAQTPTPLEAGLRLLDEGADAGAIPLLQEALRRDSLRREAYTGLALAYLRAGQPARARAIADRGRRVFPDDAHLLQLGAEALVQEERVDEALARYRAVEDRLRAGASIPGLTYARARRRVADLLQVAGSAAYEAGDLEAAVQAYREARTRAPDVEDVHANLAFLLLEQQDAAAALTAAERGLAHFPESERLLRFQAAALLQLDRLDELLAPYEALYALRPDDPAIGLAYAQVLLASQQRLKALGVFETLLRRHPTERSVYDAYIEAQLRALNLKGVEDILQYMRRHFPEEDEVLRRLARVRVWQEEWDAARATYDTLATLTGDRATSLYLIGQTYEQQDSLHAALNAYDEGLALRPADADLLAGRARVLEAMARWEAAEAAYEALLATAPSDDAYARLGHVLEQRQEPGRADRAYRQALAEDSTQAFPVYRLAVLARADGRMEQACVLATTAATRALQALDRQQQAAHRTLEQRFADPSLTARPDLTRDRLERANALAADAFAEIAPACPASTTEAVHRRLLAAYPTSGTLHLLVGRYHLAQGDTARALALADQAAALTPALPEAHRLLATLHEARGDDRAALLAAERFHTLAPDDPDGFRRLLRLYRAQGGLALLIARWQARFEADPTDTTVCGFLLEALHKADRYDEATALAPRCDAARQAADGS
ncbi:hypothetical protein AWN76_013120 [Rhodothermaceae bacterium RA]|nr:hypothetical protein AWN76_013120 [Rhodothermaceae bacterium RA]